jgi:hypothetical protein
LLGGGWSRSENLSMFLRFSQQFSQQNLLITNILAFHVELFL